MFSRKIKTKGILLASLLAALIGLLGVTVLNSNIAQAAAGINERMNFQGRLYNGAGAVIADGDYNMEFKLVQDGDGCNPTSGTFPCSGTVQWTETRTGSSKVTVRNGYFSVELGSVTALPTNIWNQDTLWLSVNIGGTGTPNWDGEMKPMKRLTASPYALNSKLLGGLTSGQFLQLAQGIQVDSSNTNASIAVNKTGSANLVQLQGSGTNVLTVSNTGALTMGATGKTALSLSDTSTTTGLTIGGDTNLYRSSSNVLKTDSSLEISGYLAVQGLVAATGSSSGFQMFNRATLAASSQWYSPTAGNTRLYDHVANVDRFVIDSNGDTGFGDTDPSTKISIAGSGSANGITFGDDASNPVNLYRSTADTLHTDDSMIIQGNVSNNALMAGTTTFATGTIEQTGTDITCSCNTFTAAMSGGTILYNDGTSATITYVDSNSLTSSVTKTVTAGSSYSIRYGGLNVSSAGYLTVGSSAAGMQGLTLRNHSTGNFDSAGLTLDNGSFNLQIFTGAPLFAANTAAFMTTASSGYAFYHNNGSASLIMSLSQGGNLDVAGSLQAGSGNVTLTDATGNIQAGAYAAASIDGDDINSNLAGNGLSLTAGSPDTLDVNTGNGLEIITDAVRVNQDFNFAWTNSHAWTFAGSEGLSVTNSTLNSASDTLAVSQTLTGDVSSDGLSITVTNNNASASTGTNYGFNLVNANNGANTSVIDGLAIFSNDQATETLADGVIIRHNAASGTMTDALQIENTTAGGTITNAINILETGGTVVTGINIGNNVGTGIAIGTGVTTGISVGSGGITIVAGALAVNSDSITSDGTLAINANGTVNIQDVLDVDSTIQAGSSNVNLTLGTGFIDGDALTLATSSTAGATFSSSGLEVVSDGLTLLKGCSDGQILKWDDSVDVRWECANDTGGSGTLQTTYAASSNGVITLDTTRNGILIRDASGTPVSGTPLFAVQNNAGTASYLQVTSSAITGGADVNLVLNSNNGLGPDASPSGGILQFDNTFDSTGNSTANKIVLYDDAGSSFKAGFGISTNQVNYFSGGAHAFWIDHVSEASQGSQVFTLSDTTGEATFRNAANSAKAFQVQNAAGTAALAINTLTGVSNLNMVAGPSFEQNIHGWVAKGSPTGSTPIWDNAAGNALYGSGTLKFIGDATGDGAQYGFPFKANTQYSVSFWAKVLSGTGTISFDRQDNGVDVDSCSNASLTTSWQKFTCTFTTGATIDASSSNIFFMQTAAGTPTVYIDGLSMVQGATAVDYIAPASGLQIDQDYGNITFNANQDADIQPWQLNSNAIPTARRGATTVTGNGYAYFIGGTSGGTPVNTINYAKINGDGSLAAWSTLGTGIPVALYGHSSMVANGYVYVIGGCTDTSATAACTTPVSTVYYAKMNSDGTLGTWQTNAYALGAPAVSPAARGFGALAFSNGYAYYLGGYNATGWTHVYSGRLNADGSISAWTQTTSLGSARYGHTTLNVNGKIYSIGGCNDSGGTCGTAISTVEYATPANDGTLSSWTGSAGGVTQLPTATGFHSSAMLNGHIFNIGGRQSAAPITTVYHAKVNSVGAIGAWTTSSNPLPAARQQAASLFVNSYIYNLGGFDGSATATSQYYASGSRVTIFGGLDLVSLNGQTLTDYAGAGTLTAGNTRVVGDIRVDGFADLNNGLSVDSVINLNALGAALGQVIFNINNTASNSIFNVKHMATNFGSLATAGAFANLNSYYGEEFNEEVLETAVTADSAIIGDNGTWYADTTSALWTISQGIDRVNGTTRAVSTNTAVSAIMFGYGGTQNVMNKIFDADNLPVAQIKFQTNNTAGVTNDYFAGLTDEMTATATDNDTVTNGVYFTTNNAGQWVGQVRIANSTTGTTATCGAITTGAAVMRIEVLAGGATGSVRFLLDTNAADGVNLKDCGTITGSIPTVALGAEVHVIQADTAQDPTIDLDYFRVWQDDQPASQEDSADSTTTETTTDTAPLTAEEPNREALTGIIDFTTATSEDTVINKDLYVNGTLFADKIVANQIEGLELLVDKIAGRPAQTGTTQVTEGLTETSVPNPSGPASIKQTSFETLQTVNLLVLAQIEAKGGLVVDKDSTFNGKASFMALAEFHGLANFNDKVTFNKQAIFNSDAAGAALIKQGARRVDIRFGTPYDISPLISANWVIEDSKDASGHVIDSVEVKQQRMLDAGYSYIIANVSKEGFTLILNKSAEENLQLHWLATPVNGAKISESQN